MHLEKRKEIRYIPNGKSFASLETKLNLVGKITDIGFGGLAMEYITDERQRLSPKYLDIFITDQKYMLSMIPCTLVYQTTKKLPSSPQLLAGQYLNVHCGLKFGDLGKDKKEKLAFFLENRTEGLVEREQASG